MAQFHIFDAIGWKNDGLMEICGASGRRHNYRRIKINIDSELQSMDHSLSHRLAKSLDNFLLEVVQLTFPHQGGH
jgi:hypothetical protein